MQGKRIILVVQYYCMLQRCCFTLALITLFFACKKKTEEPTTLRNVTIDDLSRERSASTTNFIFTISLDKPASSTSTVNYETVAGTALANTDFKPVTGTATFNAGQQEQTVTVQVTPDSLRKPNQNFFVQLSNPQNLTIGTIKGTGTIINENGGYLPVDNTGYTTPATYPGYTLAWADEFTGNSINSNFWTHETGNNNGWGNNELENYTNRKQNSFVSAGNLIIEARKEPLEGFNYTSARMVTKTKKSFQFGRIDIRAKLPVGKGIWPALWMLGNNIDAVSWPACGEIDILEYLGQDPKKIYATLHWGANFSNHIFKGTDYSLSTGQFNDQFHVYSLVWTQDNVKILVDDIQYYSLNKTEVSGNYPFNSPFFFIFNLAVGGNWPGAPDGNTQFPQRLVVDYVRAFQ